MNFSEKGFELLTEEFDLGAEKILKNIEDLESKPFVKVGILESAGKHKKSDLTVADIATMHEYGTEDASGKEIVPERSFIRSSMMEKEADLEIKTVAIFDKILDGALTVPRGLGVLGLEIAKNFKAKINSNIPPALAASTIKAKTRAGKAGDVALVDTGQMRNSIAHEVVPDGTAEEGV